MTRNLSDLRRDFPILDTRVYDKPLVYLDNAATMQMPRPVWEAMEVQQSRYHANVHRGIHYLSESSTARMEGVRETVRAFLNARSADEIIFTSGATQALNLAAASYGRAFVGEGDEVLVTEMEHHANFVPWQQMCRERGARFRVLPIRDDGELDLSALETYLTPRTKLFAVTCVSNVLGTVNPVQELVRAAHARHIPVLLDAAQAVRSGKLDVQALECDFLCFSGHKLGGPTGTGVLFGRRELLEAMPPAWYGGGMVEDVTAEATTFTAPPLRFESGTPNITGIIGLGAAIDYLAAAGPERVAAYEETLLCRAEKGLRAIPGVEILGAPAHRAGAVSFNLERFHSFDVAELLDKLGIAVRSGHHCAQPLLRHYGLDGAVRVSPAFYNTPEEIDALLSGVERVAAIGRRGKA